MKLGIIGAGRVGLSIGKYFSSCDDVTVTGYYSKTLKSAGEGASYTGSSVFTSLGSIFEASDTLLITTPDDEIGRVWDCIVRECCQQKSFKHSKVICHCSGSLSSAVFSENPYPVPWEDIGTGRGQAYIAVCSMHPMYAFHHKYESFQQLKQVFFTLEGDEPALESFCRVLDELGNHHAVIKSRDKIKYHCAASMASNHVIGLISKSIAMLTQCGFGQKAAYDMLKPLVQGNVENIFKAEGHESNAASEEEPDMDGVAEALTGPIERGDTETVKKHLELLDTETAGLYRLLGRELLSISRRKHPDYNNQEMEDLLH